MNGGVDRIDTSYEELRTYIQKQLSTAKNKDEYVSYCKSILQEIAGRPDCDKFLGIHETGKTLFYDFTPELIMEVQKQIAAEQRERDFFRSRKINVKNQDEARHEVIQDQRTMMQELGQENEERNNYGE